MPKAQSGLPVLNNRRCLFSSLWIESSFHSQLSAPADSKRREIIVDAPRRNSLIVDGVDAEHEVDKVTL